LHFSETDSPLQATFSNDDLRALLRIRTGLSVSDQGEGRVRLGPIPGFAGSVALPSGRRIVISPKAGARRLPDLLALAYATLAPPVPVGITSVADTPPSDWLFMQLAAEVEQLIARGLQRGYVERRDELPYARGRLHPPLNPARLPFLECTFAEFSLDTPENRLLRGALEYLTPGASNATVRRKMRDALSHFQSVPFTPPSLLAFSGIVVNRLNKHYLPSLRLAELALQGAGVTDAAASSTAPAYLLRMWRIWELAVAQALRHVDDTLQLSEQPVFTGAFKQVDGDPRLSVSIVPDILVGRRASSRHVIDVKWRSATVVRHGGRRLRNDHLYQMATYCKALGCDGTLMYPLMDDYAIRSAYTFGEHKISVRTVDLEAESLADLQVAAEEIAARVTT
jgi:5-methylcytosine-specific restriction enzyme subunit McrC